MMFDCGLQNIFRLKNGQSRSINWENRNGEKGKGGMASRRRAILTPLSISLRKSSSSVLIDQDTRAFGNVLIKSRSRRTRSDFVAMLTLIPLP